MPVSIRCVTTSPLLMLRFMLLSAMVVVANNRFAIGSARRVAGAEPAVMEPHFIG